ncbi:MAG TPA: carbonic anhydrase [Bacteroidales bacterium]|jgi:carbonic anhydrase|nr:carbonic anhydrase [Bacteroidales bacterium]
MTTEEINKHDERELLLDSIRDFNEREYIPRQELFEGLKGEQKPHTLFIGCSDSRVVPHMLTNSLAGDLFVVRNIANLVPFYETETKKFVATSAVIEYAVLELKVENIVVCGHSNCGGCGALYMGKELDKLHHTKKWLELAQPVKEIVEEKIAKKKIPLEKREEYTEKMNVVLQLRHLMRYPYIRSRVRAGKLTLYGWYYSIEEGRIYNYDKKSRKFIKVE